MAKKCKNILKNEKKTPDTPHSCCCCYASHFLFVTLAPAACRVGFNHHILTPTERRMMKHLNFLMALSFPWTTGAFQSTSFTFSVGVTNPRAQNSALHGTTIRVAVTDSDNKQQQALEKCIETHPLLSMMDVSTEFVNLSCTEQAADVAAFDETVDSLDIACFGSPTAVQSWLNTLDHAMGTQDQPKEESRRGGNGDVVAACIGSETARVCLETGRWQAHNIYYPKGADDVQGWADSAVQAVADLMERHFWEE